MKSCSDYRAEARETLDGRWLETVLMSVVVLVVAMLFSGITSLFSASESLGWDLASSFVVTMDACSTVITILLVAPLEFAMFNVLLRMKRGALNDTPLAEMFGLVKGDWSRYVVSYVLELIIILLISIPTLGIGGIIFTYAYKMVPFLLHDYPELTAKEALKLSREMMKGYKWDLFLLDLSFIGWALLAICTFGVGLLWLMPYQYAAEAAFYEDVKAETVVEG